MDHKFVHLRGYRLIVEPSFRSLARQQRSCSNTPLTLNLEYTCGHRVLFLSRRAGTCTVSEPSTSSTVRAGAGSAMLSMFRGANRCLASAREVPATFSRFYSSSDTIEVEVRRPLYITCTSLASLCAQRSIACMHGCSELPHGWCCGFRS